MRKASKNSSEKELAAVDAERTVEDMKKAEYMREFLGEVFDATISNVTSFGMFAALENTIEGLIRFSDLTDDYYVFDESKRCIYGERTGKIYKPGDTIRIQVVRADALSGKIDFCLYNGENLLEKKKTHDRKKTKMQKGTAKYLRKKRKKR